MSDKLRRDKHDRLRKTISLKLIEWNYSKTELATMLNMSLASYYNKVKNSDTFTYRELQTLFEGLRFSDDQLRQVI